MALVTPESRTEWDTHATGSESACTADELQTPQAGHAEPQAADAQPLSNGNPSKEAPFPREANSGVLFSRQDVSPEGEQKSEVRELNAQRAAGIGTSYANAPVTKHQNGFFPVAEEAFEPSRNSSESQSCLPRQQTQR